MSEEGWDPFIPDLAIGVIDPLSRLPLEWAGVIHQRSFEFGSLRSGDSAPMLIERTHFRVSQRNDE